MHDLETRIRSTLAAGPDARVDLAIELLRPFVGRPKKRPTTLDITAPRLLRRVFDALGDGADVGTQDRLLAPSGWSLTQGKLRFAEENQSVCEWACDLEGDDPRVYYKHHRESAWADEHVVLSTFLLRFSIVEILLGAEHVESAPVLSDDELARVIEPMRRLDLGDASWPELPTRLYARSNALAFVSPNGPGASTVYVGAAERDDIAFLDDLIDGDWD